MSKSSRNLPELPPSSATVTIAVISTGYCFNARNNTGSPVPPPMITILGCLYSFYPVPFLIVISRWDTCT